MSDIKYTYPLILNKVASPHYVTPVLRRARLLDWLHDAAPCRATVIIADAGYGKTTLLWQWEREASFRCYWYKLDRTDRDWTFHISYLIEAISKDHRGFGRRAHSMLQQMGGPSSSRPGVAAYLLAEMHQRLTEPCTFIIDDWQYVNAVTEVRGLWNQILRDAPPTCRFVFSSRVKPKLQFARFKTHGGYAELRTDELRFTEDEIGELFRDTYNDPLEATDIAELERRTEGWAASLQLVEVSLRDRSTPDERRRFIRSITATRDSDLFNFLAEEVLDQQPEETKNFLLSTSILHQITPEVAERLTGVHDGRRELVDLEHRGLFTNRLDDVRYRYHNLFREFLERRLLMERSEAEVIGLHIHAASYFETSEEWPQAIHHYLRAGLQRQAARLIAKYGEEVVAEGRLGLVDEWLQELPEEAIRSNARLSLLLGEACGMRGEWDRALAALQRARSYFARKGDPRLEALACLKLSTVYSNSGDSVNSLAAAEEGASLVPQHDDATRLRLEGNLAITRTWLNEDLEAATRECLRIAEDASQLGLDHFAAIAYHNAGALQRRMGKYGEAVSNLERAGNYWAGAPTSPFADGAELVDALVSAGRLDQARQVAADAVIRTRPWPRPSVEALCGQATVLMADGRFNDAADLLEECLRQPSVWGSLIGTATSRLIEAVFMASGPRDRIARAYETIRLKEGDPRYVGETASARAISIHATTKCKGECQRLESSLRTAAERGALATWVVGRVVLGALALEHGRAAGVRQAWDAAQEAVDAGLVPRLRWWLRRYARHVRHAINRPEGAALIARLVSADPDGWRSALLEALPEARDSDRQVLLQAISRHANRQTVEAMMAVQGRDVAETRRQLRRAHAARLFLRTLGGISLHRGDWSGPALPIEKKRVRMLLAVLAARTHTTLTREMAIEILWPDADADAGVNNLNQTVFQLRRHIDPNYRGGESPDYIVSTAELVSLNTDLVRTDLDEIRRLPTITAGADWAHRQAAAVRAIGLVRGEFLADLRYDEWTGVQQLSVHNEVRGRLLPIALSSPTSYDLDISISAAQALVALDPYDETAVLALADCLSRSGRRVAARDLVVGYAERVKGELDDDLSPAIVHAADSYGASSLIKSGLTRSPLH